MLKRIPKLLILLPLLLLLAACAQRAQKGATGNTDTLAGLLSLHAPEGNEQSATNETTGRIREMALKETALSLGAQAALASRAKVIDEALTKQTRNLDVIYDFNALLLEHNVLPPVLLEGRNTLNMPDTQTIRVSDRVFKVAKQARFVTTPPNWRQYLWMDYQPPDEPHVTLLPRNKDEQIIWTHYIEKGWGNGEEQANYILEDSIARIKEDFLGMLLYRKLLAMNMVSPPYISHTDLGITGDGDEIHIDDRVLRITALPVLNMDSSQWKAAVAKEETTIQRFKNMEKLIETAKITITNQTWQPVIAPVN